MEICIVNNMCFCTAIMCRAYVELNSLASLLMLDLGVNCSFEAVHYKKIYQTRSLNDLNDYQIDLN